MHLPLAVRVAVTRPDASRWVLVTDPALPLVTVLPMIRPVASRVVAGTPLEPLTLNGKMKSGEAAFLPLIALILTDFTERIGF